MQIETQELEEIKTIVGGAQMAANGLIINTQADMDYATELLSKVHKIEKKITEKKKSVTEPLMQSLKSIRELFAPLELQYSSAKQTIKGKMVDYVNEQDRIIAEEKARLTEGVIDGSIDPSKAAEAMPEDVKANIRIVKKVRIVNEKKIPKKYLMPNMALIVEDVLRKGITIPGIEMFDEKIIAAK